MENTLSVISDIEVVSFLLNAILLLGMGLAIIFAKRLEAVFPKRVTKRRVMASRRECASFFYAICSHAR